MVTRPRRPRPRRPPGGIRSSPPATRSSPAVAASCGTDADYPLLPAPLVLAAVGENGSGRRSAPRTGHIRAGRYIRDVMADLYPLLRLGQLLPHGERRRRVPPGRRLRSIVLPPADDQQPRPGPASWAGPGVDRGMVQRARPVPAPRHDLLSEGSVTTSRRSSVSRMRENRTYGLKGMGKRARAGTAP
jgi:hypothetical protein